MVDDLAVEDVVEVVDAPEIVEVVAVDDFEASVQPGSRGAHGDGRVDPLPPEDLAQPRDPLPPEDLVQPRDPHVIPSRLKTSSSHVIPT